MNNRLLTLFAIFLLSVFINSGNTIYATSNISIDLINQERINKGLTKLEIDENLCTLAKMLADDKEVAYPEEINDSLFSNLKYKPFLKDYSNYVAGTYTINDVLVNLYKKQGTTMPAFTEEQVAQQSIAGGQALALKITHGCTGISSGQVGEKPYGYFIGGVKKEVASPIIDNNLRNESIIAKIRLFFSNLFSKLGF